MQFLTWCLFFSPAVQRIMGVEANLVTCARVRDEIVHRLQNPDAAGAADGQHSGADLSMYPVEDPEVTLHNAIEALQQEEAAAEAEAAVVREERDRVERGLPLLNSAGGMTNAAYAQQAAAGALATPVSASRAGAGANSTGRFATTPGSGQSGQAGDDLTLTPIPSGGPISVTDRPVRCPFCVNQRMLRTIKEAVEHLSTHVVV
jgi:hypothetical protein